MHVATTAQLCSVGRSLLQHAIHLSQSSWIKMYKICSWFQVDLRVTMNLGRKSNLPDGKEYLGDTIERLGLRSWICVYLIIFLQSWYPRTNPNCIRSRRASIIIWSADMHSISPLDLDVSTWVDSRLRMFVPQRYAEQREAKKKKGTDSFRHTSEHRVAEEVVWLPFWSFLHDHHTKLSAEMLSRRSQNYLV